MHEKYKSLEEKYNLIVDFEQEKVNNIFCSHLCLKEFLNGMIKDLEETLETEKDVKIRCIADLEREKIEAIERMKVEFANKIEEIKENFLDFKTEQLDTASRIAVIENHKLKNELEIQSKEVEKIIARYKKLEGDNVSLKRDVQIHIEVENEFAKKSNRAQSLIKKLADKIKGKMNL